MITGIASIELTCGFHPGTPLLVMAILEAKARDLISRTIEQEWRFLVIRDEGMDWEYITEALDGLIRGVSIGGRDPGDVTRQEDVNAEAWRWSGSLHSSSLELLLGDGSTLTVQSDDPANPGASYEAPVQARYLWRLATEVNPV